MIVAIVSAIIRPIHYDSAYSARTGVCDPLSLVFIKIQLRNIASVAKPLRLVIAVLKRIGIMIVNHGHAWFAVGGK